SQAGEEDAGPVAQRAPFGGTLLASCQPLCPPCRKTCRASIRRRAGLAGSAQGGREVPGVGDRRTAGEVPADVGGRGSVHQSAAGQQRDLAVLDRKSTRLNS